MISSIISFKVLSILLLSFFIKSRAVFIIAYIFIFDFTASIHSGFSVILSSIKSIFGDINLIDFIIFKL